MTAETHSYNLNKVYKEVHNKAHHYIIVGVPAGPEVSHSSILIILNLYCLLQKQLVQEQH